MTSTCPKSNLTTNKVTSSHGSKQSKRFRATQREKAKRNSRAENLPAKRAKDPRTKTKNHGRPPRHPNDPKKQPAVNTPPWAVLSSSKCKSTSSQDDSLPPPGSDKNNLVLASFKGCFCKTFVRPSAVKWMPLRCNK